MAISWVVAVATIGLLTTNLVESRPAADPDCVQNHDHSIHTFQPAPSPNYGPPRPVLQPLALVSPGANVAPPAKYTGPLVTEEETHRLHADAIAEREKLIAQQNAINAAGPAKGGPGDETNGNELGGGDSSSSESEEDCDKPQAPGQQGSLSPGAHDPNEQYVLIPVWFDEQQQQLIGTHSAQVSSSAQASSSVASSTSYSGPKVTKEETEKLHAEAIAKQKELIALQEQINAAGPAPAGASGESDGGSSYGQSVSSSVSLVQGGAQQQTNTYTGPKVTKEETEKLHAEAIAKQKELIALQEQINAAGPAPEGASGGSDGSSSYGQSVSSSISFVQGGAQQQTNIYTGPKVTKEETEKLHAEAIAKQKELIALQEQINAAGPAPAGASGESDTGSSYGQSVSSSVSFVQGGAQQQTNTYTGPKVTKEETEKLHAEAIAKQKELIALQQQIAAAGPAKPKPNAGKYPKPSLTLSQSVSSSSASVSQQSQKVYTGPKVTKEETEKLHAEAIAKQKELIALQEQINAAGPAKAGPNDEKYEEPQPGYGPPAVQTSQAFLPPVAVLPPALSGVSVGAVVSASAQKPYTGPTVSPEETAHLHAEAIAAHAQLVAQQEAINAAGPAKPAPGGGGDGSYESGPDCDKHEGGSAGVIPSAYQVPLPQGNQAVAAGLIETQISGGGAAGGAQNLQGGGSYIIVKGPQVTYGVPSTCCDGKY